MAGREALRRDDGSGLFSTVFGVGIFLSLMMLSVQVVLHLYTTSVIEAVGFDAAQMAAGAAGEDLEGAERRARELLGGLSTELEFSWAVDDDRVVLTLTADRPRLLPRALSDSLDLGVVRRTFHAHREEFR